MCPKIRLGGWSLNNLRGIIQLLRLQQAESTSLLSKRRSKKHRGSSNEHTSNIFEPLRLQLALFMGLASTAMLLWENQHWQKKKCVKFYSYSLNNFANLCVNWVYAF